MIIINIFKSNFTGYPPPSTFPFNVYCFNLNPCLVKFMMFKLLDRPGQPRGRLTLFYSINLKELESMPQVVKRWDKYSLMFF